MNKGEIVAKTEFLAAREVSLDTKLEKGRYVLVPATFQPSVGLKFILNICYQKKDFSITKFNKTTKSI